MFKQAEGTEGIRFNSSCQRHHCCTQSLATECFMVNASSLIVVGRQSRQIMM